MPPSPTMPIQYRCERCSKPITSRRPGWIEFCSVVDGHRTYPQQVVLATIHHGDCGETTADSYAIGLPDSLNHLGDFGQPYGHEAQDSLADWWAHLSKKTWCTPDVLRALDRWEPERRHRR